MNWTVYADGEVLARSVVSDPKFQIVDPRVTAEVNKAGTFEFTIYPEHPYYDKLFKMKTLLRVELNDETIFDGRVLYTQTAMNRSRKVYCEGVMAYLLDSIQESHEYNKNTPQYYDMTVADYVDQLLINHNLMFIDGPAKDELANYSYGSVETAGTVMSQFRAKLQELLDREVETGEETIRFSDPEKIIYTGTVNAVGSAGYGVSGKYKFEVTGHARTLDVLQNTLVETIGGYMRVQRRMNAGDTEPHLYLDWTNNFDGVNTQSIDFGVNMLDFTMDESGVDVFTRLYPTGKPSGSSKDTEVVFYPSENGAKIIGIMENEEDQKALEDRYGVIVRAVEFSDCDNAETLKKLVWNYVERYAAGLPDKLSLTALDLRSYGVNILQMGIGRKLTANARRSHGLYRSDMTCISIDYYLRAPDKNIYVLSSAPTGADATPKFSTQQSATASTASSARRSASSAARTAETAQTAASTAVEVSNTTKTEVGDVEQLMYYIAYSSGVDIGEGTGRYGDYKDTFVKAYAQALGIAIDPETGEIARDIEGNFAFDYSLSGTTGQNANRVYSAFEAKADKATLISEINASAFQPITFDTPLSINPQELGYYEKDARGNYIRTTDQTPVTGKTYYERSSDQVISRDAVEASPGGVLIDAINSASNKTIDYSKVQVQPKSVLIKTINGTSEENAISGALIDLSNQGEVLIKTINGNGSDKTTIDSSKVDVNGILTAAGLQTRTITGPDGDDTRIDYGKFFQLDATDLDVDGSLFLQGSNVGNAVTGFGSATYTENASGQQTGEVKIPYYDLLSEDGEAAGYITFNMANTSFFQTQMALARQEGASEAGTGHVDRIIAVRSIDWAPTIVNGEVTKYMSQYRLTAQVEDGEDEDTGEKTYKSLYTRDLDVDAIDVYNAAKGVKTLTISKELGANPSTIWATAPDYDMYKSDGLVDLGGYYYIDATPVAGEPKKLKFRVPGITSLEAGELGQTTEDEDEPGKWVATLPLTAKYGSQVLKTSNVEIDVTSAYSAGFTDGQSQSGSTWIGFTTANMTGVSGDSTEEPSFYTSPLEITGLTTIYATFIDSTNTYRSYYISVRPESSTDPGTDPGGGGGSGTTHSNSAVVTRKSVSQAGRVNNNVYVRISDSTVAGGFRHQYIGSSTDFVYETKTNIGNSTKTVYWGANYIYSATLSRVNIESSGKSLYGGTRMDNNLYVKVGNDKEDYKNYASVASATGVVRFRTSGDTIPDNQTVWYD